MDGWIDDDEERWADEWMMNRWMGRTDGWMGGWIDGGQDSQGGKALKLFKN